MDYYGRYIPGDTVGLAVVCTDANGVPTLPDQAPVAVICSGSAQVATLRLPVHERHVVTAFFHHPIQLDTRFATGHYRVVYQYTLSGVAFSKVASFEVAAGGHADGPGLALFYFARPASDFVLMQADSGRIIRRRNPRIP